MMENRYICPILNFHESIELLGGTVLRKSAESPFRNSQLKKEFVILLIGAILCNMLFMGGMLGAEGGTTIHAASEQAAEVENQKNGAAFPDVADSYAKQEILSLAASGILSGYENGNFEPTHAMTRAELAKILVLTAGFKQEADAGAAFKDVPSNSWYQGYVGALVKSGITQGTSDTTFSPEEHVTREQLVAFFVRAMGLEGTAAKWNAVPPFTDWQSVSEWARPSVSLSYHIHFTQGIDNGDGTLRFNPKEDAQRQALAKFAYLLQSQKEQLVAAAQKLTETAQVQPTPTPSPTPVYGGGGGGGGGGKKSSTPSPTPTPVAPINNAGTIAGDYTISSSGVYGPAGLAKVAIQGVLYVNPGPTGEVTLQNIDAKSIQIMSGSANTIKVKDVHTASLLINTGNQANAVRLLTQSGTVIDAMEVKSSAIIENAGANTGAIIVNAAASNKSVEVRGAANQIVIEAEGASLIIASDSNGSASTIKSLDLQGKNNVLSGKGSIEQVNIAEKATSVVCNIDTGLNVARIMVSGHVKLQGNAQAIAGIHMEATANARIEADPVIADMLKQNLIRKVKSSIELIGSIEAYTEEKEQLVASIRKTMQAALLLQAKQEDFGALDKLLLAEKALNEFAVAAAKQNLAVLFSAGDSEDQVTHDITLPGTGILQTSVTWSSSDESIITKEGKVTRPSSQQNDAKVGLTAEITRNGAVGYQWFTLVVKAMPKDGHLVSQSPTVHGTVYADAAWITGWADPKALITAADHEGTNIGRSYADGFGFFLLPLKADLNADQTITLVAEDIDKAASPSVQTTVAAAAVPQVITAKPVVEEELYADSNSITASLDESAVIRLKNEDGHIMDAIYVKGSSRFDDYQSGIYELSINLKAGETVAFSAKSNGKKPSGDVKRTVHEVSGQTATPVLLGQLYETASTVQIQVEAGAVPFISGKVTREKYLINQVELSGKSYDIYNCIFIGGIQGQTVEITAKAPGKTISNSMHATFVAAPGEKSDQPFVYEEKASGYYDDDYHFIEGKAPYNSFVLLRNKAGELAEYYKLDSEYAKSERMNYMHFESDIDNRKSFYNDGFVYVSSVEYGKAESEPFRYKLLGWNEGLDSGDTLVRSSVNSSIGGTSSSGGSSGVGGGGSSSGGNSSSKPKSPIVVTSAVYDHGGSISVRLEDSGSGNQLLVRDALNRQLFAGYLYGYEKTFEIDFDPLDGVIPGDQLYLTVYNYSAESDPAVIKVLAATETTKPSSIQGQWVGSTNYSIYGRTEPGAEYMVKNALDGAVLYERSKTDSYGIFHPSVTDTDLYTGLTEIQLEVRAPGKKPHLEKISLPQNGVSKTPTVTIAQLYADGGIIKGTASPDALVWLETKFGEVVDNQKTHYEEGNFQFYLHALPKFAGDALYLRTGEQGKAGSAAVTIEILPIAVQTQKPAVADGVTDEAWSLQGEAESMSIVTVVNTDGTILGKSRADRTGTFEIQLERMMKAKSVIYVYANAPGKTISEPLEVLVQPSAETPYALFGGDVTSASESLRLMLHDPDSTVLATDDAGYLIAFANSYEYTPITQLRRFLIAGENVSVRVKEAGRMLSSPAIEKVKQGVQTVTPTVTGDVYDILMNVFTVKTADPYSTLVITRSNGKHVRYNITFNEPNVNLVRLFSDNLAVGEKLLVAARTLGKAASSPVSMTVKEALRTAQPTVTGNVYGGMYELRGFAEQGAEVYLCDENGETRYLVYASSQDGSYIFHLPSALEAGQVIQLKAQGTNKKESSLLTITVKEQP